jgi:ribosomal protein S6--L-glutamate ligase
MIAALRARGHEVVTIDPEAAPAEVGDDGWLDDLDLVVGRGRSQALLFLLTGAERRGTRTVNRRMAIAAVHNKAEMAVTLATAGVPTPKTFLGSPADLAAQVPSDCYPIIVKPSFGDNCQGLRMIERPDALAELAWPEPLVLAQQFLATDGNDLKLYGIGDEVWAVRKPSPLGVSDGAGSSSCNGSFDHCELVAQTKRLRDLGRRCGELFGLELYGVDCLETPDGTVVVEVNEFPNYTGVPAANNRLADYVVWRAQGRRAH